MEQRVLKRFTIWAAISILIVCLFPAVVLAAEDDGGTGQDEGGLIIRAIEIRGNNLISDRDILAVMKGRAGDKFSASSLFDDLKAIEALGYFRSTPAQLKEPLAGGVKIIIIVEEYPLFGGIEANIIGVPVHTPEEVAAVFLDKYALPKGQIINNNNLADGYIAIERLYREGGYTAASITSAEIGDDGVVRLEIHEGIIHSIEVEGLHKTRAHVILRELELKEGDIFNALTLRRNLQEVYNLQLFQDIEVKFDLTPDREVILIIDVEEARTGQLGFGAGFSTEDGLLATFSYSELNFRGVGQRLTANAQIGGPDPDYLVNFFNPRIDSRDTSFSLEGYTQNTTNRERSLDDPDIFTRYTTNRKGGAMGVIRPLTDDISISLNLRFLTGDIQVREGPPLQDISEFARRGLIDGTSNAISTRVIRDTRDFIFDPSRGSRQSISATFFGGLLGGDFNAVKYEGEFARYFLLNKSVEEEMSLSPTKFRDYHIFAIRILAGGSEGELSLMDRFEVGGSMSLRGSDVAVQTGNKSLLFNAEYRFPLITNLSGAVFFDSGTAAPPGKSLNLDNLVNCIGAGIRYRIPFFGVAPIRLEYGYDLTNQQGQFVFGFGQLF